MTQARFRSARTLNLAHLNCYILSREKTTILYLKLSKKTFFEQALFAKYFQNDKSQFSQCTVELIYTTFRKLFVLVFVTPNYPVSWQLLIYSIQCQWRMQFWSRHFTETARQDCMGFGNIAWLTEIFNGLDGVRLDLLPVAGQNAELLFLPQLANQPISTVKEG